ncbi:MAG: type II secretion system GspH family protein [Candidatus Scalindua rubra]|nr:type II secretion system GspH family protein [Candidatus Scalindua rubra]
MEKVKSEKGFTLLELIFVMVIIGTLSSSLILPFISNLKQATRPEIYNTATYIAVGELEKVRSDGYNGMKTLIGTANTQVTKKGRTYDKERVTEYVTQSAGSFNNSATPTELIRVTVTIANPGISSFSMWELLTDDFYN